MSKRPSFFIVGAPRCGTTSLTRILETHPQIFMSPVKVPMHFGKDLFMSEKRHMRDPSNYLALFRDAAADQICGESTVFYLFSEYAAAEIRAFDPSAKIIIMLRNPVDMMHSMHWRNLRDGNETEKDFARALVLEEKRKRGKAIPQHAYFPQALLYRDLAKFSTQIQRFKEQFPESQIHVILMDDIKTQPDEVIRDVAIFLGVTTEWPGELTRSNPSVSIRSARLASFLRNPPTWIETIPKRYRAALLWRLMRWNEVKGTPSKMRSDLRARLIGEFDEEIVRLSGLLQRDLAVWRNQVEQSDRSAT